MIQKTIQDYYETICSEYPNIPESDIKRILQYGWKSLYLHSSYGGDVLLNQRGFWFYVGQLTNNSLKHFNYYKRKMRTKMRILYKRKHIEWDGYYYFALTSQEYDEYKSLKHKRGRPRKNFTFTKVILYKLYDECNIMQSNRVAIFRIPFITDLGFTLYKQELMTDKAELILERPPLNFNDILLSNYEYQFMSDNKSKHLKNTADE